MTVLPEAERSELADLEVRAQTYRRKQMPSEQAGLRIAEQLQSDASHGAIASSLADRRPVNPGPLRGDVVLERLARSLSAYGEAAERAFGDARALLDCWAVLGRGLQHWQHTYIGLSEQMLSDLDQARRKVMCCGTALEIVEQQRAASLDLMKRTMASNVALLQIAVQIGRDATGPLRALEDARRSGRSR